MVINSKKDLIEEVLQFKTKEEFIQIQLILFALNIPWRDTDFNLYMNSPNRHIYITKDEKIVFTFLSEMDKSKIFSLQDILHL